jgi:hypothetical protein
LAVEDEVRSVVTVVEKVGEMHTGRGIVNIVFVKRVRWEGDEAWVRGVGGPTVQKFSLSQRFSKGKRIIGQERVQLT